MYIPDDETVHFISAILIRIPGFIVTGPGDTSILFKGFLWFSAKLKMTCFVYIRNNREPAYFKKLDFLISEMLKFLKRNVKKWK